MRIQVFSINHFLKQYQPNKNAKCKYQINDFLKKNLQKLAIAFKDTVPIFKITFSVFIHIV